MSCTLSKFCLPFDKAPPSKHFPKALKRPRNNAGLASIYMYICILYIHIYIYIYIYIYKQKLKTEDNFIARLVVSRRGGDLQVHTVHHTQTVEFFELKFLKNRSVLKETV